MDLHRISVKYFVEERAGIDLPGLISVFHGWIQRSTVPGMLIDVADYQHMADGPAVVLVGHDVEYAFHLGQAGAGLMHTRKRGMTGDAREVLASLFRAALIAARTLEQESALKGKVRFRTDAAQLIVPDRLRMPNNDQTFQKMQSDVDGFLKLLYEGLNVATQRDTIDPRCCFAIQITAVGAPDLNTLIQRIVAKFPTAG